MSALRLKADIVRRGKKWCYSITSSVRNFMPRGDVDRLLVVSCQSARR
jgi:hypothetical protein